MVGMSLEKKRGFFKIGLEDEKLLNFKEIFGNENPVHLEIGSGRGEFISMKSLVLWNKNFLGLELKDKRIDDTLKKLNSEHHRNVRLIRLLVDEKITDWISENSIERIYINHPDPWPKKKHHKNRLIQNDFLDALYKILKFKGVIEINTDHRDYAEWIVEIFKARDDFKVMYENGFSRIPAEGHIVTHFEEKKRREGFEPLFMRFKKI
ncbi:MAG TPA: tRNA (guanosine(46)-N7)-methyltransferase TrmB [Candidatus Cloacimonetes bacterium]|nr:tRNA (guanosine(46)-N7)-methyltransferase TrmB [Candidatus Cloacimonadota bacterium]